jgi:MoxR-like ATPase
VDYPPAIVEEEVLRRYHQGFNAHDLDATGLVPVIQPSDLPAIRATIHNTTVEDGILRYITALATATRRSPDLILGGSPRASIALLLASKTYAALQGRDYVTPDDIKAVAPPVFRHRIILRPEAEIEGLNADSILRRLLAGLEVPR